jgi:hypothetical protein
MLANHSMNSKHPRSFFNFKRALAGTIGCVLYAAIANHAHAAAVVTTATGPEFLDIRTTIDNFRTSIALGGHANGAGFFTNGFRVINWDAVSTAVSDPNLLPGNFFNSNSPRGLLMSTPGVGFLLSAPEVNPTNSAVRYGTLDPSYPGQFKVFSEERLFIALGSTITENRFFVPSTPEVAASIFGFGVVFTDVDIVGSTSLEFFDLNGGSLGRFNAPAQDQGLSFLGVSFDAGERVGSVRITAGTAALGAGIVDSAGVDVVAMDDFIYSEPIGVVPEPGTTALALLGLGSMAGRRRRPVV